MKILCDICPHLCSLDEGETGKCLVRRNTGKAVELLHYGECSRLALEPIEKRPFFHFYPAQKFLSVGFLGCSFACDFCQNYTVSQSTAAKTRLIMPKDLVDLAEEKRAKGIVFTYNEPTVHYEYLLEVGIQLVLRNSDLKMAVKTSGFVSKHILRDLSLFETGFNVDIKGDDQEYQKTCGGTLRPVMEAIEWLVEIKSHLEISYLVLPRQVADKKHHRRIRDWLSELDPNIPVHLLYFYPFHKMIEPTYEVSALIEVLKIFLVKMKYVYISNIFRKNVLDHRHTKCKKCGETMIERSRKTIVNKLECCGLEIKGLVV